MLITLKKDGFYNGKDPIQDERELMWNWNNVVEIEGEVTFEDLLNNLYSNEEIMNVVSLLTQTDLSEYKEEFNKESVDSDMLQSIEFSRTIYLQGPQLIDGVSALGIFKEPRVNEDFGVVDRVCSLGFIPWSELKNLPLKVLEHVETHEEFIPKQTETCITVGEFLSALFEELGFYGPPNKRDETKADLQDRMAKIDSGEAKLIPWEEVKTQLEAKLEEHNATEE